MELELLYEKMEFPGVKETVSASEVKSDCLEFVAVEVRPSNVSTVQYWGLNG